MPALSVTGLGYPQAENAMNLSSLQPRCGHIEPDFNSDPFFIGFRA